MKKLKFVLIPKIGELRSVAERYRISAFCIADCQLGNSFCNNEVNIYDLIFWYVVTEYNIMLGDFVSSILNDIFFEDKSILSSDMEKFLFEILLSRNL